MKKQVKIILIACAALLVVLIAVGVCVGLFSDPKQLRASNGLKFEAISSSTCKVISMGTCRDTEVVIPDKFEKYTVTEIGEEAFKNCENIKSVTIPETVTVIGKSAFAGCVKLENVSMSDNVTEIASFAFSGCKALKLDKLPESITTLGAYAFKNCTSLAGIIIQPKLERIGNGAFEGCTALEKIDLPDTVKSIGNEAFNKCTGLTEVSIANPEMEIGGSAFLNCTNVRVATLPLDALNHVPKSNLAILTLTDGTVIPEGAFAGCNSLISITLPQSITEIGDDAFSDSQKLVEIYNLSSLEIKAGKNKNGDIAVNALDVHTSKSEQSKLSVMNGGFVFYEIEGAYSLIGYLGVETDLVLPESYKDSSYALYKYAFSDCGFVESITIPGNLKSVGSSALADCTKIKTAIVPAVAVPHLPKSNLEAVEVNGGTAVFDNSFKEVKNLKSVTLCESIVSIGNSAFEGCTGLSGIYLPAKVNTIGSNAFAGCTGLKSFGIPGNVTSLGDGAFSGCSALMSVTIPEGVESIGSDTFKDCSSLVSVTVPNGVTAIGNNAFKGCSKLAIISVPNSVTKIGNNAFADCINLASIVLPKAVTAVGDNAFAGCACLRRIAFEGTVEEWNAVTLGMTWTEGVPTTRVVCSDAKAEIKAGVLPGLK